MASSKKGKRVLKANGLDTERDLERD